MSLNLSLVKMQHSNFKRKATEFEAGVGRCSCGQTFEQIRARISYEA